MKTHTHTYLSTNITYTATVVQHAEENSTKAQNKIKTDMQYINTSTNTNTQTQTNIRPKKSKRQAKAEKEEKKEKEEKQIMSRKWDGDTIY